MADLQTTFRRNLKSIRKRLDLSQRELSKQCNYDTTYIGKIERGECIPSLESMNRLAEALDTSPLDLLMDSERSVRASTLVPLDDSLSRSRLDQYFDLLEDPPRQVLFLDLEGRVLEASDSFYQWVDAEPGDLNGEKFVDLPIPDVTNLTRDGLRRTLDRALNGDPVLERLVATENDREGGGHMALSLARVSPENSSDMLVVEVVHLAS